MKNDPVIDWITKFITRVDTLVGDDKAKQRNAIVSLIENTEEEVESLEAMMDEVDTEQLLETFTFMCMQSTAALSMFRQLLITFDAKNTNIIGEWKRGGSDA